MANSEIIQRKSVHDYISPATQARDEAINCDKVVARVLQLTYAISQAAADGQMFMTAKTEPVDSTVASLFRTKGYTFAFGSGKTAIAKNEIKISWQK